MKLKHLHYASVSAIRAAAAVPMKDPNNNRLAERHSARDDGSHWHGIDGGAEAVKNALVNGFPAGEAAIAAFHSEIAASLPRALGHHRTKRRSNLGDELDIHAVNRGATDRAWTLSSRTIRKGSGLLRLVVDICGNATTSAETLQWRGIAALSLNEVMSRAGYSVEIVAAMAVQNLRRATGSGKTSVDACLTTVVVKPRGTQADIGLLAATLTLSGFFRLYGFLSFIRAADDAGFAVDSGLGNYLDASGVVPVPDKVSQIIVPQSVHDKASALEWVQATVKLLQGARA